MQVAPAPVATGAEREPPLPASSESAGEAADAGAGAKQEPEPVVERLDAHAGALVPNERREGTAPAAPAANEEGFIPLSFAREKVGEATEELEAQKQRDVKRMMSMLERFKEAQHEQQDFYVAFVNDVRGKAVDRLDRYKLVLDYTKKEAQARVSEAVEERESWKQRYQESVKQAKEELEALRVEQQHQQLENERSVEAMQQAHETELSRIAGLKRDALDEAAAAKRAVNAEQQAAVRAALEYVVSLVESHGEHDAQAKAISQQVAAGASAAAMLQEQLEDGTEALAGFAVDNLVLQVCLEDSEEGKAKEAAGELASLQAAIAALEGQLAAEKTSAAAAMAEAEAAHAQAIAAATAAASAAGASSAAIAAAAAGPAAAPAAATAAAVVPVPAPVQTAAAPQEELLSASGLTLEQLKEAVKAAKKSTQDVGEQKKVTKGEIKTWCTEFEAEHGSAPTDEDKVAIKDKYEAYRTQEADYKTHKDDYTRLRAEFDELKARQGGSSRPGSADTHPQSPMAGVAPAAAAAAPGAGAGAVVNQAQMDAAIAAAVEEAKAAVHAEEQAKREADPEYANYAVAVSAADAAKEELRLLEGKMEAMRAAMKQQDNELRDSQNLVTELQTAAADPEQIRMAAQDLARAEAEKESLEQVLEDEKANSHVLEERLETRESGGDDAAGKEIELLTSQVSQLQADLAAAREAQGASQSESQQVAAERDGLRGEIEALTASKEQLKEVLAQLQQQNVQDAKDSAAKLREKANKASAERTSLREEITKSKEAEEAAKQALHTLRSRLKVAEAAVEDARKRTNQVVPDMSDTEGMEAEPLRAELERARVLVASLQDDLRTKENAATAGWEAAAEAEGYVESKVEEAVAEAESAIAAKYKKKVTDLTKEAAAARDAAEQLTAENEQLKARQESLQEAIKTAAPRAAAPAPVDYDDEDDDEEEEAEDGEADAEAAAAAEAAEEEAAERAAEMEALREQLQAAQEAAEAASAATPAAPLEDRQTVASVAEMMRAAIVTGTQEWKDGDKTKCAHTYKSTAAEALSLLPPSEMKDTLQAQADVAGGQPAKRAAITLRKAFDAFLSSAAAGADGAAGGADAGAGAEDPEAAARVAELQQQLEDMAAAAARAERDRPAPVAAAAKGGAGSKQDAAKIQKLEGKVRRLNARISELEEELANGGGGGGGSSSSAPARGGAAGGASSKADKDKIKGLQKQLKEQKVQMNKLEKDLNRAQSGGGGGGGGDRELKQAERKLADAEKKHKKAVAEMEKTTGRQITRLESQLKSAQEGMAEADGNIKSLTAERNELREKAKQLGSMGQEMETLRARADLVEGMEKQVSELQQQTADANRAYREEMALRKKYYNMMEDMKGKIRVYARCRPMAQYELDRGCHQVIRFVDDMTLELDTARGPRQFTYDQVYNPNSSQVDIYEDICSLCQCCLDGFNVCVFAYGQTGSGKTWTMTGVPDDPEKAGISPRVIRHLFEEIDNNVGKREIAISSYMLEIYNEKLVDLYYLLDHPQARRGHEGPKLEIKVDTKGMVNIKNSTIKPATNADELFTQFTSANELRHVGSTAMNAGSSRSHSILSILVSSFDLQTRKTSTGKLSLIDLAGSERAGKTGATADRLKEAQAINKSLSALGDVISALSSGEGGHIPYRNNILTRVMQDSLGGNAKTAMYVNISPADYNADETGTSLAYAARVKMITNQANKNTDSDEVAKLKAQIKRLKQGLAAEAEEEEDAGAEAEEKKED